MSTDLTQFSIKFFTPQINDLWIRPKEFRVQDSFPKNSDLDVFLYERNETKYFDLVKNQSYCQGCLENL